MCYSLSVTWSELGYRPNQCSHNNEELPSRFFNKDIGETTLGDFPIKYLWAIVPYSTFSLAFRWIFGVRCLVHCGYMLFQRDVLVKLATCTLCLLVYLTFYRICPVERVIDDPFIMSQPFYMRILYLYLSMLSLRPKYYFVWTLGEWGSRYSPYESDGYVSLLVFHVLMCCCPLVIKKRNSL